MIDSRPSRPSGRASRRRFATVRRGPWLCHCSPSPVGARHPRSTPIRPRRPRNRSS